MSSKSPDTEQTLSEGSGTANMTFFEPIFLFIQATNPEEKILNLVFDGLFLSLLMGSNYLSTLFLQQQPPSPHQN